MDTITHIVVHCTATREREHITAQDIHRWHLKRGFAGIGYHYVIHLDGTVEKGRPDYWKGAHVKGANSNKLGVVYVGGLDRNNIPKDTRTKEQKQALLKLVKDLKKQHPFAEIEGHRDFSPDLNNNGIIEPFEWIKVCPCFDAKTEYNGI